MEMIEVFSFDELDKDVQRDVINKFINDTEYYEDCDWIEDKYNERLKEFGFFDIKWEYNVGFCQGDYARFTAKVSWDDVILFLREFEDDTIRRVITLIECEKVNVWGDVHNIYRCSSSVHFEYDINVDDEDEFEKLDEFMNWFIGEYHDAFLDFVNEIEREFRKDVEEELLYQISDEYIIENIKANEYRFLKDGKMI